MTETRVIDLPLRHTDRFFIGGEWVAPSSDARIEVDDSNTEQIFLTVPEAMESDLSRAIAAARDAFDNGPWPRLTHGQRAEYVRALTSLTATRSRRWPSRPTAANSGCSSASRWEW